MFKALRNWERCRDKIATLRGRLGFSDSPTLKFLRLSVHLENGQIYDELRDKAFPEMEANIYCILYSYADAKIIPETFSSFLLRNCLADEATTMPTMPSFGGPFTP